MELKPFALAIHSTQYYYSFLSATFALSNPLGLRICDIPRQFSWYYCTYRDLAPSSDRLKQMKYPIVPSTYSVGECKAKSLLGLIISISVLRRHRHHQGNAGTGIVVCVLGPPSRESKDSAFYGMRIRSV
jgi:hypothetical protein